MRTEAARFRAEVSSSERHASGSRTFSSRGEAGDLNRPHRQLAVPTGNTRMNNEHDDDPGHEPGHVPSTETTGRTPAPSDRVTLLCARGRQAADGAMRCRDSGRRRTGRRRRRHRNSPRPLRPPAWPARQRTQAHGSRPMRPAPAAASGGAGAAANARRSSTWAAGGAAGNEAGSDSRRPAARRAKTPGRRRQRQIPGSSDDAGDPAPGTTWRSRSSPSPAMSD